MKSDYLTLWTVQPIEWYEKLLRESVIFGRKDLSDWYKDDDVEFRQAYDWLVVQMEKRISPKPFENALPVWAWCHYLNADKKRPDLRGSGFLLKGQKGVRIEFRKKRSEVLLSDFDLWHCVLNYFYIADNEKEDAEFDTLLNKLGLKFTERENAPTEIHEMITKSWEKVLDMNYSSEYSVSSFEKKSIQATFWSLSVGEIVKVDKFTAR